MNGSKDANMDKLLTEVADCMKDCAGLREILLANAIMLGEIPSPTFGEQDRIRFLTDRFTEAGLSDISVDEAGNAVAVLPGRKGDRNIVLAAHADTQFPKTVDHAMRVDTDRVSGPGIANNSIGLATVAVLPTLLDKLNFKLDANVLLLASVKSHGHGDLGGLRFFLENHSQPIHQAICVEGVHLGRLSYSSLGMVRAEITVEAPEETTWHHFGRISAARVLTRLLNRIYAIPIPREPKTSINIGTVAAGSTFSDMTTSGRIRFEIRSEDLGEVERIRESIVMLVEESGLENQLEVRLEPVASRNPGGIPYSHPMVVSARRIMQALDIKPRLAPSVGDLSAFIAKGVPAVTFGLTTGGNLNSPGETIKLKPLPRGLAQIIMMLRALDQGYCDEDN